MEETAELAGTITVAEALSYHAPWLASRPADYGADLRARMLEARSMTALTYLRAAERRREYEARFHEVFREVDVVVAPTLPVVAPMIGEPEVFVERDREDVRLALLRLTRPGNLSGAPAISVPCGFTRDDLPVGLQIMGPKGGNEAVFRVALSAELPGE
jgi:aspartyl-tRNA(Asn)/glutamyl-tRNA(Gln) amidotransferase subunit A